MDAVACLINKIKHAWGNYKIKTYLFIDIKGAFNHIVRSKLIEGLQKAQLDKDLIS